MPARLKNIRKARSQGFSLLEVVVVLGILALLTVTVTASFAPWIDFKSKIDTQRKLEDSRHLFSAAYDANAMSIDTHPTAGQFRLTTGTIASSVAPVGQACPDNRTQFAMLSSFLPSSNAIAGVDGHNNPLCIFVSNALQMNSSGVRVFYRNIALVSAGKNGLIDAGTAFNATTGALTIGNNSDDSGVVVNGSAIQIAKIKEIQVKLDRIANLYETYFSIRFQTNPARDITVDYFNPRYDIGGTVLDTQGTPQLASLVLSSIGVGESDSRSSYETNNEIVVANFNETLTSGSLSLQVKSPQTKGQTLPPYTALIGARIPAGNSTTFMVRTAAGNY